MNTDTVYVTGFTQDGIALVGGIWRMYRQEGLPVDISILALQDKGLQPDIMELFAEATIHSELPQVEKQWPEIFTDEIKFKWMSCLLSCGLTDVGQFEAAKAFLLKKREDAPTKEDMGKIILLCLELKAKALQLKEHSKPTE